MCFSGTRSALLRGRSITEANASSALGGMPPFSSSTREMINIEPFFAWPPRSVSSSLEGQGWFSPGATQIPQGYYQPILTQAGWTGQLNIASETLFGMDAGGYHGIVVGFIKVEDGYFRAIEMDESTGAPYPTNVNIFVSDIVPLSQIIAGYKPSCPAVSVGNSSSTLPRLNTYSINLPNTLMLVDSQGRRTGEDPSTGILYNEIPGASYSEQDRSGQLSFSEPSNGQYTLYVLGGATGPYDLESWVDDGGPNVPIPQKISGDITEGSMIAYLQDYNAANIASSTLSASSTALSTASITSAPPDNLPPPTVP